MDTLKLKAMRFLGMPIDEVSATETNSIPKELIDTIMNSGNDTVMRIIANKDGPLEADDFKFVLASAGPLDDTHNMLTDDITSWDDSILDAYAKHIDNYLYKYRDKAKLFDNDIDTDETQIGPMAQDIEQVNPACVDTLADGTKTVDTSKLALMNAGAIADLARKLDKLLQYLEGRL